MELDAVDRRLIQALLENADRSLRALADEADVTAPTVASRIERLEGLGVLGPVRREAALPRLGTLVLIEAPPEDQDAMGQHGSVFATYRTQQNRTIGLALLPSDDAIHELHEAFPHAQTTILSEQLHASTPTFASQELKTTCDQCGKSVEGSEGIEIVLGETRYVVCCPMCKQAIQERYERHDQDA